MLSTVIEHIDNLVLLIWRDLGTILVVERLIPVSVLDELPPSGLRVWVLLEFEVPRRHQALETCLADRFIIFNQIGGIYFAVIHMAVMGPVSVASAAHIVPAGAVVSAPGATLWDKVLDCQ